MIPQALCNDKSTGLQGLAVPPLLEWEMSECTAILCLGSVPAHVCWRLGLMVVTSAAATCKARGFSFPCNVPPVLPWSACGRARTQHILWVLPALNSLRPLPFAINAISSSRLAQEMICSRIYVVRSLHRLLMLTRLVQHGSLCFPTGAASWVKGPAVQA